MHHFTCVGEIAEFFYDNYYHFLRFEDHTVDYNGITYKMEFPENVPVPILKLSYYTDDGTENVLLCVVDFGLLINSDRSQDDHPEIVEYVDIMAEGLFGLTLLDIAKFNHIFLKAQKDLGY